MANTSSAKKAQRVADRRRVYNARRKKTLKETVKDISRLITSKDAKKAEAMLPVLFKAIDKAQQGKVIEKNTAGRMKSRIVKNIRALAK